VSLLQNAVVSRSGFEDATQTTARRRSPVSSVHSVARCDGPDFTSAGSHFNTAGAMPGMQGHDGDLPSLLVNKDGTAELRVVTDRLSVADLLAGSGTALIVHAGPDNFANIPARYAPAPDATTLATGDAGARIACGLIQAADPAN
jgi:Cu-Zn family superoxide dismutase